MDIPEEGRLAAHVLVDAVSVAEHEDLDVGAEAANLSYQRLVEAELIPVHVDGDESDEPLNVTVDLSNVLGGALITMNWLIEQLALARGRSRDEVLVALREYLDS